MERRKFELRSNRNHRVTVDAIPGHFVTSHSHINYYIDITKVKHEQNMARDAAAILAQDYLYTVSIDTVVCMEGSEIIGAFVARELSRSGLQSINEKSTICVVSPENDASGQMIFRDNLQPMIIGKNVLLLIPSITTGKTIRRACECIRYYGGNVQGITAVFSAADDVNGMPINAIFTRNDLPDYTSYSMHDCPDCKAHRKIDAIVNSYGYSKMIE